MKTNNLLVMALSAMLFMGCSVDNIDEPIDESPNLELISENTRNMPFIISGFGNMKIYPPNSDEIPECEGYTLIETEGISSEQTLGRFTTTTRICTDRDEYYTATGVHTFPNGEKLYFHAVIEVESRGTKEVMCVFDGGTGRFEGATGMVNLFEETIFHDADEGTYTHEGEGIIYMGKGS